MPKPVIAAAPVVVPKEEKKKKKKKKETQKDIVEPVSEDLKSETDGTIIESVAPATTVNVETPEEEKLPEDNVPESQATIPATPAFEQVDLISERQEPASPATKEGTFLFY